MPYYEHIKCLTCGRSFAAVTQHYYGVGEIIPEKLCQNPAGCHGRCVRTTLDVPASFTNSLSVKCGTKSILDTPEARQAVSCEGYDPHDNKSIGASTQVKV